MLHVAVVFVVAVTEDVAVVAKIEKKYWTILTHEFPLMHLKFLNKLLTNL